MIYDESYAETKRGPVVETSHISLRQRFRLFFSVIVIVVVLTLVKAVIHVLQLEFLNLNPLFPSIVASSIFIIGFLLSSILADYKESERMPAEIRMALEAICDDAICFARRMPAIDIERLKNTLSGIVVALQDGLGHKGGHTDLEAAINKIDQLTALISEMDRLGMVPNYIVRMRSEQDILRRCVYRIHQIQKMQFVPSVHVLVQTLVAATLFVLLFLKTEGTVESSLIFGFVSYIFVYALYLVDTLEQPFRKGRHSVDDVSLFLLRGFVDKVKSSKSGP